MELTNPQVSQFSDLRMKLKIENPVPELAVLKVIVPSQVKILEQVNGQEK